MENLSEAVGCLLGVLNPRGLIPEDPYMGRFLGPQ